MNSNIKQEDVGNRIDAIINQVKELHLIDTSDGKWDRVIENLQKQKEVVESEGNIHLNINDAQEDSTQTDIETSSLENFDIVLDEFPKLDIYPKCNVYFKLDSK